MRDLEEGARGGNKGSPTHEALEHERDAVLVVRRRHLVRRLERERRGVRRRDAEARPARASRRRRAGRRTRRPRSASTPRSSARATSAASFETPGAITSTKTAPAIVTSASFPQSAPRRGEHRVEVGVGDPREELRHRLAPRERVARRERALGPRPPVVVATRLVGRLAAEPQLELPGEADSGHLLPKPAHDPMCDVDGQRERGARSRRRRGRRASRRSRRGPARRGRGRRRSPGPIAATAR